jgi:hypothetical protein
MAANPPHPYFTTIKNVREVALSCRADLAFWQEKLKRQKLIPCNVDGKAEILIIAIESKFMGITFREVSMSVIVANPVAPTLPAGSYLLHAYNSLRLFALAERTFFQTPYYPARIQVHEQVPASVTLEQGKQQILNARMIGSPPAAQHDTHVWEGAIYLPSMTDEKPGTKVFYARLSGDRDVYPFQPGDIFSLTLPAKDRNLRLLVDSGCAGHAWQLRNNAVHARSKTFNR